MNNNEEIKKYIFTIDGVDFSGKTTLWKKAIENNNVQIRGILSNIAYGIKYGRDIDKMIEEYNKLPLNYVIYFLNPYKDIIVRNFSSRLKEISNNPEMLIKESTSFADTLYDSKYFTKAYEILKEKYKGEIILLEKRDNDIEDFKEAFNEFESYSFEDITKLFSNNIAPYIIRLSSTVDEFEAKAKKASEYVKIVFIDKLNKEDIMNDLYDLVNEKHRGMIDFLFDNANKTLEELYNEFNNASDDMSVSDLEEFLDNYELDITVDISCKIETDITVYARLSELSDCDCLEDYVNDNESERMVEALEYCVRDSEVDIDHISVS